MNLQKIFVWLISQFPGILLGFLTLLATGVVNEIFTKRAETRKAKEKLLDEFGEILIEAEENMWKELPIRERDFVKSCRKLSLFNLKLSDNLLLNYYVLWTGVYVISSKPRKSRTKEENEIHDGSIGDLRTLNVEFLNYSYPDRTFFRKLNRFWWLIRYKKFYLFKKNNDEKWDKLVKKGRRVVSKMLSNPF